MAKILSSSLPFAQLFVRILIVLNIAMGIAIVALLLVMPNREWIVQALNLDGALDLEQVVFGLRAVAVLGIVGIVFNHFILKRLVAIVETVRAGDPFVAENAYRLQAIAWFLLVLQLIGMVIDAIGKSLSTPEHPVHLDAGFSVAGWLAVVLTFVLARVFAEGTLMRRDLEGTV